MDFTNVTIGLAFLAGLASFLSPCVFSLVPAYVGYLGGRAAGGTIQAFLRRLEAAAPHVGQLIRGEDSEDVAAHRIDWQREQVTVELAGRTKVLALPQ